jgi:hypothetical protein
MARWKTRKAELENQNPSSTGSEQYLSGVSCCQFLVSSFEHPPREAGSIVNRQSDDQCRV